MFKHRSRFVFGCPATFIYLLSYIVELWKNILLFWLDVLVDIWFVVVVMMMWFGYFNICVQAKNEYRIGHAHCVSEPMIEKRSC